MSLKRKKPGARPKRRKPAFKSLLIMGLLAGLGILAGLWISPRRAGQPVATAKAPVLSREQVSGEKHQDWLEARLRILWEELGVPKESVVTFSGSPTHESPIALEVRLPKQITLGEASKALEALGREAPARVEIRWEKEETSARLAVVSSRGSVTYRILLLAQDGSKAIGIGEEPKVAVIMDDLGGDEGVFRRLVQMGIPLTLALLPGEAQAERMAHMAKAGGLEVMVHLPMEPKAYPSRNPGPRALMVSMDGQEAARLIASQLEKFPQAAGVNNHMGSRLTEDPGHMAILMEVLAKKSMYFVDSLTSPNSVAYSTARQKGLRAYRRDVFLDTSRNTDRIKDQFQTLISVARKKGYGLAICHPYPETLALLPELYKLSLAQGISWVKVSQLPRGSFQDAALVSGRAPEVQ